MRVRTIYIVLLALLLSCTTTTSQVIINRPYIEHQALYTITHWKAKQNKGIYSSEQINEYFDYFLDRWEYRGLPGNVEQIRLFFNKIEIHWQQTKFINPESGSNGLLLGYVVNRPYRNKISMFVYDCSQIKDPKLGDTALGHELAHVALFATIGNMHRDHFNGPGHNWSLIYYDLEEEVNAKFR